MFNADIVYNTHSSCAQADEGDSAQEVSATGSDTKSASAPIKAQGCPRVLKAGHATKCGAVVSGQIVVVVVVLLLLLLLLVV